MVAGCKLQVASWEGKNMDGKIIRIHFTAGAIQIHAAPDGAWNLNLERAEL
jgi:hypothetical protein